MTSWFSEAVATPAPRTRTRPAKPKTKPKTAANPRARSRAKRRTHARGAIVWILVSAVLLAGVVFVNLAVLRLNLRLDSATQERSKLRAENAALQSQLSSALASPRIQSLARRQDGLVEADPATIGYLDLGR
jgi:cell division protein FtsL